MNPSRTRSESIVATFVLVPDAWLGGWAWRDVTSRPREAGHQVYPVTLTGLGERVHLARPETDLETHITDVINVIRWNDLDDVILAGHSYAGTVVTGVADRIPERIGQLVYLDSAPLANGQAMTDLYPAEGLATLERRWRSTATVGVGRSPVLKRWAKTPACADWTRRIGR